MTQPKQFAKRFSALLADPSNLQPGWRKKVGSAAAERQSHAGQTGTLERLLIPMKSVASIPTIVKLLNKELRNLSTPPLISLSITWDERRPSTLELSFAWVET